MAVDLLLQVSVDLQHMVDFLKYASLRRGRKFSCLQLLDQLGIWSDSMQNCLVATLLAVQEPKKR